MLFSQLHAIGPLALTVILALPVSCSCRMPSQPLPVTKKGPLPTGHAYSFPLLPVEQWLTTPHTPLISRSFKGHASTLPSTLTACPNLFHDWPASAECVAPSVTTVGLQVLLFLETQILTYCCLLCPFFHHLQPYHLLQ